MRVSSVNCSKTVFPFIFNDEIIGSTNALLRAPRNLNRVRKLDAVYRGSKRIVVKNKNDAKMSLNLSYRGCNVICFGVIYS